MTERNIDQAALHSIQHHSFLGGSASQLDFIRPHSPSGLSDYDYEESFSEKSRKESALILPPNSSEKPMDLQKAIPPLTHISVTEKCLMDPLTVKTSILEPHFGTTVNEFAKTNGTLEAMNRKDSLFEDDVEFPIIVEEGIQSIFDDNERGPYNHTPQFQHNNLFGRDEKSKSPFTSSSAFLQHYQSPSQPHHLFNHKIHTPSNVSKDEEIKRNALQDRTTLIGQSTSKACSDYVSISAPSETNETGLNKYSKIYEDERRPKILINDPNDPIYQRREYEEKNREYFRKYTQAIKVAQNKGESLHGKVFDRVSGIFKPASILNDEELKKKAIDQTFFLKNGSIFSRMDSEMELLNLKLREKQFLSKQNKGGKNSLYAATLICKESKSKSDKDFILPGLFSTGTASPIKMVPKKPISKEINAQEVNESPEIAMLGLNGQQITILDAFPGQKKQKLLEPFELYHESNFIEIDTDQLSMLKPQKDNAIIAIDNPIKILPKSNTFQHEFKRPLSCFTKNNLDNDDDDDDLFAPVQKKMRQQSRIQPHIDIALDTRSNKEENKKMNEALTSQQANLPFSQPLKILASSTLSYNQEKYNPLFQMEKLTPTIKELSIVESLTSKKSSKVCSPNKENSGSSEKNIDASQPLNRTYNRESAQKKESSFQRKSYNTRSQTKVQAKDLKSTSNLNLRESIKSPLSLNNGKRSNQSKAESLHDQTSNCNFDICLSSESDIECNEQSSPMKENKITEQRNLNEGEQQAIDVEQANIKEELLEVVMNEIQNEQNILLSPVQEIKENGQFHSLQHKTPKIDSQGQENPNQLIQIPQEVNPTQDINNMFVEYGKPQLTSKESEHSLLIEEEYASSKPSIFFQRSLNIQKLLAQEQNHQQALSDQEDIIEILSSSSSVEVSETKREERKVFPKVQTIDLIDDEEIQTSQQQQSNLRKAFDQAQNDKASSNTIIDNFFPPLYSAEPYSKMQEYRERLERFISLEFHKLTKPLSSMFRFRLKLQAPQLQASITSFIRDLRPDSSMMIEKIILDKNYQYEVYAFFNYRKRQCNVVVEDALKLDSDSLKKTTPRQKSELNRSQILSGMERIQSVERNNRRHLVLPTKKRTPSKTKNSTMPHLLPKKRLFCEEQKPFVVDLENQSSHQHECHSKRRLIDIDQESQSISRRDPITGRFLPRSKKEVEKKPSLLLV